MGKSTFQPAVASQLSTWRADKNASALDTTGGSRQASSRHGDERAGAWAQGTLGHRGAGVLQELG